MALERARSGAAVRVPTEVPQWLTYPPFYRHLGLELEQLGQGRCVVRIVPRTELGNSKGDLHGGVISSMLDIVLSQAVRSAYEDIGVATINMTTSFLAPPRGTARATGVVVRSGKTIAFAEGEVVDERGECVAQGIATFRIIHPPTAERGRA